jgi:predicted component of type VI protein secretion system
VQIPDTGVSREHARIFVHNGAVWVRDAGSRNGVLVNGKRIQRPATVGPGDTIHVGDNHLFSLEWLSDEAERPRPSVAPAGEPLPPPPAPAGPPRAAIAGAVALAVLLLLGVAAAVLSG